MKQPKMQCINKSLLEDVVRTRSSWKSSSAGGMSQISTRLILKMIGQLHFTCAILNPAEEHVTPEITVKLIGLSNETMCIYLPEMFCDTLTGQRKKLDAPRVPQALA